MKGNRKAEPSNHAFGGRETQRIIEMRKVLSQHLSPKCKEGI